MNNDKEQVQLLSTFHFILGGLTALFACIPFIHVAVGIAMLTGAFHDMHNPPPPFVGVMFVALGGTFITLGWTLAILLLVAGRRLRQLRSYKYCFVVACISCALMPLGTVLGVFTILVLSRPTVKAMFAPQAGSPPVQ